MLSDSDAQYLDQLRKSTTDILRDAIGSHRSVALLDAPNQRNVGDSLIWAGQLAYMRRLGLDIRYTSDMGGYNSQDLRRAMPSGVILLRGGGNLGDIWPGHQDHRERVVRDFPDYKVVQMPQSILFHSEDRARRANEVLSQHDDFILLMRDSQSLERAQRDLPGVKARFCYDMAFGYEAPPRSACDETDVLVIAREDAEKSSGLGSISQGWLGDARLRKTDWGAASGLRGAVWDTSRAFTRLDRRLGATRSRTGRRSLPLVHASARAGLERMNDINLRGALDLYACAGVVVVDRLHAHALAALLGIPHVVLDNSYRKISAVFEEYSGQLSTAHYVTDVAEARELALDLLPRTVSAAGS